MAIFQRLGLATGIYLTLGLGILQAAPSGTILIHLPKEPASLDWNLSSRRIDELVIMNLHEGLLEVGPNRKARPLLAKSWNVGADGKTYTFFLRTDAKWSDGKPIVAQHFVDSWRRLISPLTATGNGYFLLEVVGAEDFYKGRTSEFSSVGIKALNDYTIQVQLRKPLSNWELNFALPASFPIRQDLIDKHGAKFWTAPGNLVTAGPYTLESHDLDSSYVLKKNVYYTGHTGNITEIQFKIVPYDEAIAKFANGKMDLICYLSGAEHFSGDTTRFLKWTPANTTKRLDINVKRFPLDWLPVRQAIALAIDREKLAKSIGLGNTAASMAAPPALAPFSRRGILKFDPVLANRLLRTANLDHLTVEILVPLFDEHAVDNLKAAEIIQEMLTKNLHANVTLQRAETEQLYSLLRDTRQYSLLLRDWTGTNDPDEFYSFYATQTKKSTSWSNVAYDQLVERARAEKNEHARIDIYRKMEKILIEDEVAMTPLFYKSDATLVGPRISGFEPSTLQPCQVRDLKLK